MQEIVFDASETACQPVHFDVANTGRAINDDLLTRQTRPLTERHRDLLARASIAAALLLAHYEDFRTQRLGMAELGRFAQLDQGMRGVMPIIQDILGADLAGTCFASAITISQSQWAHWLSWVIAEGNA